MKVKEGLYWLFFLGICFGAGYLHGSLPQYYVTQKVVRDPTLTIILSSEDWKTETFQVVLEEALDREVELKTFKTIEELLFQLNQNADFDYGILPSSWTEILTKDNHLKNFKPNYQVATDFLLENYEVPLFWNFSESQLFVYSFVAFKVNQTRDAEKDLSKILKKHTYEILLKETRISGTLERLEKQSLKKELKPSHLRTLPLKQIKQRI